MTVFSHDTIVFDSTSNPELPNKSSQIKVFLDKSTNKLMRLNYDGSSEPLSQAEVSYYQTNVEADADLASFTFTVPNPNKLISALEVALKKLIDGNAKEAIKEFEQLQASLDLLKGELRKDDDALATRINELQQLINQLPIDSKVDSSRFDETISTLSNDLTKLIKNIHETLATKATKKELEAVKGLIPSLPEPITIVADSSNVTVHKRGSEFGIEVDIVKVAKEVSKGGSGVSPTWVHNYVDSVLQDISAAENAITNLTSIDGSVTLTPILNGYDLSVATGIQGRVPCTSANTYTITHAAIDSLVEFPVVSLELADGVSDIFVVGIYDRTDTSFKVVLSGTPSASNAILYHISSQQSVSASVDLSAYTLLTTTSAISAGLDARIAAIGDVDLSAYTLLTTTSAISAGLVPYIGANSSVNLGDQKLLTDAIQLDLTPVSSPASTTGLISWNNLEGCANVGMGDVTLQVGLESLTLVYNSESFTILNGQLVYVSSSASLDNIGVKLAKANEEATSVVFGMATQDISAGQTGFVTTRGKVRDIDTSSISGGSELYLSDSIAGGWTAETSGFALHSRKNRIGWIGNSHPTSGYVYITLDNEQVINSLSAKEQNIAIGDSISTGVYEFTGMTIATSSSFTIPPLKGFIVENTGINATNPLINHVIYNGGTLSVTNITTQIATYVLIDKDNNITQQATYPTPSQRRTNIFLGKVVHTNLSSILTINNTVDFIGSSFSTLRDMFFPIAVMNNGITVYPNGANLNINKTAGSLYGIGINWTSDPLTPNTVALSATIPTIFSYYTQNGLYQANTTLFDPGYYDLSGVRTAVGGTTSRSTNHRVYQFTTGNVIIQYGQEYYSNLANAIAGIQTESFVKFPAILGAAVLIGIISARRNATNLSDDAFAKFTPVSIFGESTGGTAGISTTTLQQAYDNSIQPEIVTNATLDGVTIRVGSDQTNSSGAIQIQSIGGVDVFSVNGLGEATVASISGSNGSIVTHDANGKLLNSGTTIASIYSYVDSISAGLSTRIDNISGTYATIQDLSNLDLDLQEQIFNISTDLTANELLDTQQTNSLNTLFSTYANSTTVAAISAGLDSRIYNLSSLPSYDNGTLCYSGSDAAIWGSLVGVVLSGGLSGATSNLFTSTGTTSGCLSLYGIVGDFLVGETVTASNGKVLNVVSYEKRVNTIDAIVDSPGNIDIISIGAPQGFSEWVRDTGSISNFYVWAGQNQPWTFVSSGYNSDIVIEKSFSNGHIATNQARFGWEGSPFLIEVAGTTALTFWGTQQVEHNRRSVFTNTIEQGVDGSNIVSTRKITSATAVVATADYDSIAHSTNFGTIKYVCHLTDGTNVRSSEIMASFSGSTVAASEINIVEPIGSITNASWSVVATGGNIVLRLTITSGTYNVRISRELVQ